MRDEEILAEFTDGHTTAIEPVTEELVLGVSWMWRTREGEDAWHRVAAVERLHNRRDGVQLRVTLRHRLEAE